MIEYEKVTLGENEKIESLSVLASGIVKEFYDPLLGSEQNDYMIAKFQSAEAIKGQLAGGYNYYVVKDGKESVGFMAFYQRGDEMYLSKYYLRADSRGKGIGRDMIAFVSERAKECGLNKIVLNVNKHNGTIAIYEKLGFVRIRGEKIDIGGGFYMDDYVYQLDI